MTIMTTISNPKFFIAVLFFTFTTLSYSAEKKSEMFRGYANFGVKVPCEGLSVGHPQKRDLLLNVAKQNAIALCTKAGFTAEECFVVKNNLVDLPETASSLPDSCTGWALVHGTQENGLPEIKR